jgi:hypothetical protein
MILEPIYPISMIVIFVEIPGITIGTLQHQWFSGKIRRCHRRAPSSILGWCKHLTFYNAEYQRPPNLN